ncbi:MAG: hypothetical protein LBT10_08840 [Methanobrevibacter sp.]|nr:hypothetical protein [Methanobrevibacter sp.]
MPFWYTCKKCGAIFNPIYTKRVCNFCGTECESQEPVEWVENGEHRGYYCTK